MGFFFDGFNIMFIIVFVFILGTILFVVAKGMTQWNKNNHSPRLTVDAKVVSKRIDVTHHHRAAAGNSTGAHGFHHSSSTWNYVTFQFESGDRMEFSVRGCDYGLLTEGDQGRLTFQGTRFLGFERQH